MHTAIDPNRQDIGVDARAYLNIDPHRQPPLGVRSLCALVDLGLSDAQIARYFDVPESRIVSLRRYYGLT